MQHILQSWAPEMIRTDPGLKTSGRKPSQNKITKRLNHRWKSLPRHPAITNGFRNGVIGKKKLKKATAGDYKLVAKVSVRSV
jgi:hypothetical protein